MEAAGPQMRIFHAGQQDHSRIEKLVLDSFESITWFRAVDKKYGPLNSSDWRDRWKRRLQKIFAEQIILAAELNGALVAMSSSTIDPAAALAYIDLLAVAKGHQAHGYGRQMLRHTMQHLHQLGARYVHLECLTSNENANALYQSEGFEEVARHIRWFRKLPEDFTEVP